MSQEPPSARFANGQSAADSVVWSGEQQFASSASHSLCLNIRHHEPPCNQPGILRYQALTSLAFQAENQSHYHHNVEFKHTLQLDADVPQMQGNPHFDIRDMELLDVTDYSERTRCEKTTSAKRRPGRQSLFTITTTVAV